MALHHRGGVLTSSDAPRSDASSSDKPRSRSAWRILGAIGWLVAAAIALVASLTYHLTLPLARTVARVEVNRNVSTLIAGELRIGHVDALGTDRIVARHVELFDANGTRVAVADHVVLVPDLDAASAGYLRFSRAVMTTGTIRLIDDGEGIPTFITALSPADTSPSTGNPFRAVVDGMEVEDVTVYGEVLGLEGLRVEDVRATGRLEARGNVEIQIYTGSGRVVEPFPFGGTVTHVDGRIHTDPTIGMRLHVRGRIDRADGIADQIAANVEYRAPAEGAPPALDLLVHADPMELRAIYEIGFDWAELLVGRARGHFRLFGPPDDLALRAWAETDGGWVRVEGTIPSEGDLAVTASTAGLDLDRLVRNAPPIHLSGSASIRIADDPTGLSRPRIQIAGAPFAFGNMALPTFELEGEVLDDGVRLDRLRAPYAGGNLVVSGVVGYDGLVDVEVTGDIPNLAADPNLRVAVGGIAGRADVDVHVVTRPGNEFLLDGSVTVRGFRYGDIRANWLRARGRVEGVVERPVVDLRVDARGLSVSDIPLGDGRADVRGGPGRYVGTGAFATEDRRLDLDATMVAFGDRYELDIPRLEYSFGGSRWTGHVQELTYIPDRSIRAGELSLTSGSQRAQLAGIVRFRGDEDIEVSLGDFDLRNLRELFGAAAPAVRGRFDGRLALRGDLENPVVEVEGAVRDGGYADLDGIQMYFTAGYGEGALDLTAQADLGERGRLTLAANGLIDPNASSPLEALENALYSDTHLYATDLDFGLLVDLVGDALPPIGGRLTARLDLDGPVVAPNISGIFAVPDLRLPDWPVLGVRGALTYESGVLVTNLETSDTEGRLADAEGSLIIDLYSLATDPDAAIASLETLPWRTSLRLYKRRLADLPAPIRELLPPEILPLRLALSGTAAGGGFETRADIMANGEWTEPVHELLCGVAAQPRFNAVLTLRDSHTTLTSNVFVGNGRLLELQADAPTPVDDWIGAATMPALPLTRIVATVAEGRAERIPWACDVAEGPFTGQVVIDDFFGESPRAEVAIGSPGLRMLSTLGIGGEVRSVIENGEATFDAVVVGPTGEESRFDGRVGVQWGGEEILPRVAEDAPVEVHAQLDRMPIAPLLAWLPLIRDADGAITGALTARGSLADVRAEGGVTLTGGYLEIAGAGQHLSGIEGDVLLHGQWLELRGLTAHDGDGETTATGRVDLAGLWPSRARITLRAQRFPVRREGSVLARVTGVARLDADIQREGSEVAVEVQQLSVRLPDDPIRDVQSLELHPDIRVLGQEGGPNEASASYPVAFRIVTTQPFWVRRADFAALVSTNMRASYVDPNLYVGGHIQIEDGWYEVFDKRFEIEDGTMNFDGTASLDPTLNFVVSHRLTAPANATVLVQVSGRLSDPIIEFRSDHPDCGDRASIIGMLVTGQCGSRGTTSADARAFDEQTTDFASGVLAGASTVILREEFGDAGAFLPSVSVERGRPTVRTPRIDLMWLVPEAIRGVVRDLWCAGEGAFANTSTDDGADGETAAILPGGRCEAQFPGGFGAEGSFNPNFWNTDLTWEP